MAKRRTQDSDLVFGTEDDPIDLTGAFAPTKGPQSVEYDEGDEAIGLTQAFEPIPDQDEPRAWDEAGKWTDFDWNAGYGDEAEAHEGTEGGEDAEDAEDAEGSEGFEAASAGDGDAAGAEGSAGEPAERPSGNDAVSGAGEPSAAPAKPSGGRGRHAAPDISQSPRMQQARRMRRVLLVIVILLVIVLAALGFYMYQTFQNSQEEARHQEQEQVEAPKEDIAAAPADDTHEAPAKLTNVPVLAPLLGMSSEDAIEALGAGAVVTANRAVDEEDNPIKTNLNVALTEEPSDSKTGTPTVYLGLDQDGEVLQVGYSASAAALGFGSLSFADAVSSDHVVEKTLARIGVDVPEGSAVLPTDKDEYSTYGSDGATVVRERCSFEGDADVDGTPCTWSSVLSYDYTTQLVTGDLSDTVRIIYAYVTVK